ncbi:MAG: hypothetical protein K2X03_03305 [Bryobacteraceae bacterium]|nr:hypothetical protein [Bryobacteraceae bacterium]
MLSTFRRCLLLCVIALSPAAGQHPPVVLVDGYHLLCQRENLASAADFGELEARLTAQGRRTVFFATCGVAGRPSIEDLGNALGTAIRSLNVPQVDLISYSMGGLVVRAYLSGKQNGAGVFTPPPDPRVRKWISIATPHFGAPLPNIITGFLPDRQAQQLIAGSPFLFDLATWNQDRDDLRGVEALGIIGNAGGAGPLSGTSDGTVTVTSASMAFARPDERTRVVPYCHGAGGLTSILGLGCNGPPIAKIQADNPLSWRIIQSFLEGTDEWKTLGRPPSADPVLARLGGVLRQTRDRLDQALGPPRDENLVLNPPQRGGYRVVIDKPGPRIGLVIPSAAWLPVLSLAPRMLISIYGTNLANATVSVNGRLLTLGYVGNEQLNALLPEDVRGLARLSVRNEQGQQTVNVWMESAAPAIFTRDGSGTGPAAAFRVGNVVELYLTGLGVDGALPVVLYDGEPAIIEYAGRAPLYPGLDQINFRVPALGTGTVVVRAGGRVSNVVTAP